MIDAARTAVLELVRERSRYVFAALFVAIAVVHVTITPSFDGLWRWSAVVTLLGALALAPSRPLASQALFAAACAILLTYLIEHRYTSANHGYMITYFSLLFAAQRLDRDDFWANARLYSLSLLAILMGFALLQKLTSPNFMSGNLIASLILGGDLLVNLLSIIDESILESIRDTQIVIREFSSDYTMQSKGEFAKLPDFGIIVPLFIWTLTIAGLLLQFAIELSIFFHQRLGIWFHRLIFVFTLLVYTMRPENVFLSLNLLMGFALTDERSAAMRLPYVLTITYFLVAAAAGFRPGLIS